MRIHVGVHLGLLGLLGVIALSACGLVDNPYLPIADGSETVEPTSTSTSTSTDTDEGPSETDTETETGPDPTETETATETDTETETGEEEFLWCPDLDLDSFGDGMSLDCVMAPADMAPLGFVSNIFDCDDNSATTHPGAAGDDDPGLCMRDDDDDGWGSMSPPLGVDAGRDCDDSDAVSVVCVEVIDDCVDTNIDVQAQLEALAIGGTGVYAYAWTPIESLDDPLIAMPLAMPDATTSYTVAAADDNFEPNVGSAVGTVHVVGEPWVVAGDQTMCSTIGFDLAGEAMTFQVLPEGTQLCALNNGDPTAIVCPVEGAGARVSATLNVTGPNTDGFLGLVWGWQSNSQFYALIWKRGTQGFGNCNADEGVVIKRFNKLEDYALEADFFCSSSANNQTVLLGPMQTLASGWEFDHLYRVVLEHGVLGTHIEIHDDTLMSEVANFMVEDGSYPSGRVGLLFMAQPDACAGPVVSQCQ
jgi:hypothetical protein